MKKIANPLAVVLAILWMAYPAVSWGDIYNLPASADATVKSYYHNRNYGAVTFLDIFGDKTIPNYYRIYLKFDLSGIPPGEIINGATLNLYCWDATNQPVNPAYLYYVGNDTWDESDIT
jgi:hypothetical protein